jgi:hypothetical protein
LIGPIAFELVLRLYMKAGNALWWKPIQLMAECKEKKEEEGTGKSHILFTDTPQ